MLLSPPCQLKYGFLARLNVLGFATVHYIAHFCSMSLSCGVFFLAKELVETEANINET